MSMRTVVSGSLWGLEREMHASFVRCCGIRVERQIVSCSSSSSSCCFEAAPCRHRRRLLLLCRSVSSFAAATGTVELLSSSSSTRRLQPLFLPLRSGKLEASLETAAAASELCFRGEEEKQEQGLEDVGNNNCDRNEEPELVGRLTFRELLSGAAALPDHLLQRVEELGFKYPTQVQKEALPVLLSGCDMILHAQTGSGKTLAYLLPMFSKVVPTRAAVQAIVVVPTRELGMQVAKVARMLAGKSGEVPAEEMNIKRERGSITVMALLDGGTNSRQKSWLKAAPPQILVGTVERIGRMIEMKHLRTNAVTTIVVDEVDAMMGAAKEGGHLQKLLSVHTRPEQRQTILASATIPQHRRFLQDCVQNKWTKENVVYTHIQPEEKIPSYLHHRYVVCEKDDRLQVLFSVLQEDAPNAAIIFVNDQSEKAKRVGNVPATIAVAEFLEKRKAECLADGIDLQWEPLVLEEDDHIHTRFSTLSDFREGGSGRCLLVATELAARGIDVPNVSHVYNYEWPQSVTSYIHRAGRTGRRPITEERGTVTSFITPKELFVLQRVENELKLKFSSIQVPT
ncbi:unnamed protein product [Sphagnum balticum]